MTVLVGGMRVLNANTGQFEHEVFTDRPGTLTNDFILKVLGVNTEWHASSASHDLFEGRDRRPGDLRWTATRVDLVRRSNSELRAIAEVYGPDNAQQVFVRDFVGARDKAAGKPWRPCRRVRRPWMPPTASGPSGFRNGPPRAARPPKEAWINKPVIATTP